jgi:hypothetical protein
MKVILTENQYRKIVSEHYDRDKLYSREKIVRALQKGPNYIKLHIKKLPHIDCNGSNGEKVVCTKIPEVIYQYLFGSF